LNPSLSSFRQNPFAIWQEISGIEQVPRQQSREVRIATHHPSALQDLAEQRFSSGCEVDQINRPAESERQRIHQIQPQIGIESTIALHRDIDVAVRRRLPTRRLPVEDRQTNRREPAQHLGQGPQQRLHR
jgi:hypothetical protein